MFSIPRWSENYRLESTVVEYMAAPPMDKSDFRQQPTALGAALGDNTPGENTWIRISRRMLLRLIRKQTATLGGHDYPVDWMKENVEWAARL